MASEVAAILQRAADKGGFIRTRYAEKDYPSSISDVTVMTFFGDIRSLFVFSSVLLKRYREEMKGSRYFILCCWPGYECFFPYVNEYWTIRDKGVVEKFFKNACGFTNSSSYVTLYQRSLNHFFEEVVEVNALDAYYNNGLTQAFWDRFKHVKISLPSVPSAAILGTKFNRDLAKHHGYKILLYPALWVQNWTQGKLRHIKTMKEFWVALSERLLKEGFVPVIYKNLHTHDLSRDLLDKCIYFEESDIFKILGAMRAVDCTLDIFSSISRLAIAARSPFVAYDERSRHNSLKEYEIDGLCCDVSLPREYIYGFPTIIENGNLMLWDSTLFANILNRLNYLLTDLDRNKLPLPSEKTEIVPYENVRRHKVKKFGVRFVKIEHD